MLAKLSAEHNETLALYVPGGGNSDYSRRDQGCGAPSRRRQGGYAPHHGGRSPCLQPQALP